MRRRGLLALGAVLVLIVAGCTGVPTSSGPQVVRTVGMSAPPPPPVQDPPKDASPQVIVQSFLDAMAASPARLDAAKRYLDSDAFTKWSGATVTIVRRAPFVIGAFEPDRNTVSVTYQPVGTLSAEGVYTPNVSGTAATNRQITYSLAQNSADQWRISTPVPPGLILRDTDFQRLFFQKSLYFLDPSGSSLVPDIRYTALTDEVSVDSFLLNQLVAGPRPELKDAVSPFVPTTTGAQRPSVAAGPPVVVQLPGAAALDGPSRRRLAAQLASTFNALGSFTKETQIADGNQTVEIPGVGDTFDPQDFADFTAVGETDSATVTYIRDGAVVDGDGKPLTGRLGSGDDDLDTAVFDTSSGRSRVAGTTSDPNGSRRLLVGDTNALTDVRVPAGPLSAPAWAPVATGSGMDEVWVASGAVIYRYTPGVPGARPTVVPPSTTSSAVPGSITAISFSPEGTRLALAIRAPDGTSQVWVGAVIRTPDVSLGPLQQVTPTGIDVSDVGWLTEITLAAVGVSASYPAGVYLEVLVDGSRLLQSSPDGLPDRPITLAVSPRIGAQWVTVGTGSSAAVWTRPTSKSTWTAAGTGGAPAPGSAPSLST